MSEETKEIIQDSEKEIIQGSDLAKWNEIEYYFKMKNAGIDFTILKVINKSNNPDGRFLEHYNGCKDAGIPIIAGYTYCYANTDDKAKRAADAFLRNCKDIPMMVLDLEDACMTALGRKIVNIINIYREAAYGAGIDFAIYTGASFYNPCLKKYADEIADIPIWWARYPYKAEININTKIPSDKYLPSIPNELMGWQYSSNCRVDGAKERIDINVWYRDITIKNTPMQEITPELNPFIQPTTIVTLGTRGQGALWVNWYLWRFGLLTTNGVPDESKVTDVIYLESYLAIQEAQRRLGLLADGKVGQISRSVFMKVC